jgi:hypothetical protein
MKFDGKSLARAWQKPQCGESHAAHEILQKDTRCWIALAWRPIEADVAAESRAQ